MIELAVTKRNEAPEDEPFLRELFDSVRRPEFAVAQLPEEMLTALLEQQFRAQRSYYRSTYPDADFLIVESSGHPIGSIVVHWDDPIRLIDISLLPDFRGQGVGTSLVMDLIGRAAKLGKRVLLHVEYQNPARHLYDRMGFIETDTIGIYHRMIWSPGEHPSPAP